MSDAVIPDAELARLRELSVAFALGECDEAGAQELYALLTGPRATAMAAAAWQQLDGTVDLRVQFGGPSFVEAVRLKLADDGTFACAAARRIGARKPLDPIEPPAPLRPRPWRRRALWFGIPMLIAATLTWLVLRSQAATTALEVPAGSNLAYSWSDGSAMILAGPARAAVLPGVLSLSAGTAWIVAGPDGLHLGTADQRSRRLLAGERLLVSVRDGTSAITTPVGDIPLQPPPLPLAGW